MANIFMKEQGRETFPKIFGMLKQLSNLKMSSDFE